MNQLALTDIKTAIGSQCVYDQQRIVIDGVASPSDVMVGEGMFKVRTLDAGLTVTASDFTAAHDIDGAAEFGEGLFLMAVLTGAERQIQCDHEPLRLKPGMVSALHFHESMDLRALTPRGARERMVCIQASPEWLGSAGLSSHRGKRGVTVRSLVLDEFTRDGLSRLFVEGQDEPLRQLYVESCALGLVARACEAASHQHAKLGACVFRQMLNVRDILHADPFVEHSLASLSRQAGVSVSTLKMSFPRLFGVPVFAYLRNVRLDMAHEALLARRWSVSEAAYAIGFSHPSSFSSAYRRRFGQAPSDTVKRG